MTRTRHDPVDGQVVLEREGYQEKKFHFDHAFGAVAQVTEDAMPNHFSVPKGTLSVARRGNNESCAPPKANKYRGREVLRLTTGPRLTA